MIKERYGKDLNKIIKNILKNSTVNGVIRSRKEEKIIYVNFKDSR